MFGEAPQYSLVIVTFLVDEKNKSNILTLQNDTWLSALPMASRHTFNYFLTHSY